jgi:hypothetical protein
MAEDQYQVNVVKFQHKQSEVKGLGDVRKAQLIDSQIPHPDPHISKSASS